MRNLIYALLIGGVSFPAAARSQGPTEPVTVESYYRIKWGSAGEFRELYKRNHQPILDELRKQGYFTAVRMEEHWDVVVVPTGD